MKITKELITPELAKELLALSVGNRNLSANKVAKYSHDMITGRWVEDTFEFIKISKDGFLLDGHHRLSAIVNAKTPIYLNVVRGVDASIMNVIDTGKSRNANDALKINGVSNATNIAAIISSVLKYEYGYAVSSDISKTMTISNVDVVNTYEKNPEYWQEIFHKASHFYLKMNRILTQSTIGKYYYLFEQKHPDKVEEFFKQLAGSSDNNITISVLRSTLIRNKISTKKLPSTLLNAYIIKTWNAYVKGVQLKKLMFDTETSESPKIA
jgi:hypothetical protein